MFQFILHTFKLLDLDRLDNHHQHHHHPKFIEKKNDILQVDKFFHNPLNLKFHIHPLNVGLHETFKFFPPS